MIYVFLVDTGTMMTLDMNLALESVEVLKGAIHRAVRVPPDKQVLLASGGESLDSFKRVCHYSAGTDTSPIFLFSKVSIEGDAPPSPSVDCAGDSDLKAQVEGCLNMPASYNTVVARTQLAQQFYQHARDITRTCRQLVHDQHLQQQGWAAVVANLEDIVSAFKSRYESFQAAFEEYLTGRDQKVALLQCFEEDLKLLARVPVFPELLGREEEEEEEEEEGKTKEEGRKEEDVSDKVEDEVQGEAKDQPSPRSPLSLLDWISAKDTHNNVRQIAELSIRGLSQISEQLLEQLEGDVGSVMLEADRPQMKEVKGLEERLFGLETLMQDAANVVQEQYNFSQALLKNQDRAGKVNDPSIFPDLCTSHRKNLMHMLKLHHKLQDIKRRCIKAKEELSENLHVRLKWIMYIEKKLYEIDTRVEMHHESLRRLTGLLQVVDQIHRAPRIYAAAVAEVARRQAFSKGFLQWASKLSTQSLTLWRKEVEIRQDFYQQFSNHFLAPLFPGMVDLPPDYATSLPNTFDLALPKVTQSNIEELRTLLPELEEVLTMKEVIAVPPLLCKVMKEQEEEEEERKRTKRKSRRRLGHASMKEENVAACLTEGKTDTVDQEMQEEDVEEELEEEEEEEDKKRRSGGKTKHFLAAETDFPKHMRLEKSCQEEQEEEEEEEEEEGGGRGGGMGGVFSASPPPPPPPPFTSGQQQDSLALQVELSAARSKIEKMRERLTLLGDLKGQVTALRERVESEANQYLTFFSQASTTIVDQLLKVREETERERKKEEEEKERKREQEEREKIENVQEELRNAHKERDTYMSQLEDAHREIDVYMEQLQRQQACVQQAATEMEEQRQRMEEDTKRKEEEEEERHKEETKKLTLEHELEMENLRQELATLRQNLVDSLEDQLEERLKERLQLEKDRIVKILEASFSEREKNAMEGLKIEMIERLSKEREQAIQEEREKMLEEREREQQTREIENKEERERYVQEVRRKWEQEREREVKIMMEERERQLEDERHKHRLELETIRSRFKMMTTTTSTSSSSSSNPIACVSLPLNLSTSPLDEGLHSPQSASSTPTSRWEGLDRLREELIKETERETEERIQQARDDERKKVEEEKQAEFAKEVRKVTQDKGRVIEDLRIRIELLSETLERRREGAAVGGTDGREELWVKENVELKEQLAAMQTHQKRLETELARMKRFSFISADPMQASSASVDVSTADPTRRTQTQHDTHSRDRVTPSPLPDKGGHLSLNSCQPGDIVLVTYDPKHHHYKVLLEGQNFGSAPPSSSSSSSSSYLHFLHSDSYTLLGLSKDNPQQKLFCAAEVVNKEFCQAKKDDNRFRVPKGTRFYRVIAKPWSPQEGVSAMQAVTEEGCVVPGSPTTTTTTAAPAATTTTTATADTTSTTTTDTPTGQ